MRKFLDTMERQWFTVMCITLTAICVGSTVHSCAAQDRCEEHGGTVIDRGQDGWRCVVPGAGGAR